MAGNILKLTVEGFKSIQHLIGFGLGPLNVLIGANGAGKSNLVSLFRLLGSIGRGKLQAYATHHSDVDGLFFQGIAETPRCSAIIQTDDFRYRLNLTASQQEQLIISGDYVSFPGETTSYQVTNYEKESGLYLGDPGKVPDELCTLLCVGTIEFIKNIRVYHFQTTDPRSGMRRSSGFDQGEELLDDGENLSAFLFRLRSFDEPRFRLIVQTLQRVAPYVEGITFDIDVGSVEDRARLIWTQRGSKRRYNAQHFSDGTIRLLCLITTILQPQPPSVLVLDEPEIGLHPEAIGLLASLLRSASQRTQVILSTQDPSLVSQFDPADIVTVEHRNGCSLFKRLDQELLSAWMEDYTLGQLWQMGVIEAGINVDTTFSQTNPKVSADPLR